MPPVVRPAHAAAQVGGGFLHLTRYGGRELSRGRILESNRPVAASLGDLAAIADLRLADQREGDRRLEVQRFRHAIVVHERAPGLAAEQASEGAVGMAEPERVAVAEEVTLDEDAEVTLRGRSAHVEVQTGLS